MRFHIKALVLSSSRKSKKPEESKKSEAKTTAQKNQEKIPKNEQKLEQSESNKGLACRICLDSDFDEENPLVSPCKCTGTMGVIHVGCLQKWLKSKVVLKKNTISSSYQWKNLNCELCSTPFPGIFK
jgi:E3 ubiquitin-protein ligase DOA10